MSTIRSYTDAAGETRYKVRYKKPDGKWTFKQGFKNKRTAESWLQDTSVGIATGQFVEESKGRITLKELRDKRLSAYELTLSNARRRTNKFVWLKHVEPKWGDVEVRAITTIDIIEWIAELKEATSQSVMEDSFYLLSALLRYAVLDREVVTNPATGVRLPRRDNSNRNYLLYDEVELLAECAGPQWEQFIIFLAFSGLRIGEAAGLQVRDVSGRKLHIVRSLDSVARGEHTTPTKTGNRKPEDRVRAHIRRGRARGGHPRKITRRVGLDRPEVWTNQSEQLP